jgi:hypothetical protein
MHKILLALSIGASVFAVPAFAQVIPGSATQATAHGSTQAGAATSGMNANAGTSTGASTSTTTTTAGTQPLGLGGLLKQTQASDPALSVDAASEGAGPTGGLNAKARAKAHAHGH